MFRGAQGGSLAEEPPAGWGGARGGGGGVLQVGLTFCASSRTHLEPHVYGLHTLRTLYTLSLDVVWKWLWFRRAWTTWMPSITNRSHGYVRTTMLLLIDSMLVPVFNVSDVASLAQLR